MRNSVASFYGAGGWALQGGGAGHIGNLCLAYVKIPHSLKEARVNINPIVCTGSLGPVSLADHLGKVLLRQRKADALT